MKINLLKLQTYIDNKLISVQKHPDFELFIYNYTQRCQFQGAWDEMTKMCRGLIADCNGTVVARPFDKFFNLDEDQVCLPNGLNFTARDKMDGSLGILYKRPDGLLALATRGSFTSDQAVAGTEMLYEAIVDNPKLVFKDNLTYLFEIIYPENRIVVDYKGQRKLVFLGARNIETGEIILPEKTDLLNLFESAALVYNYETPRNDAEGVVLYYANGYMCKVKYAEYVRLHRLITDVTARRVWECLKSGTGTKEMLERVPEEFSTWVKATTKKLSHQFESIMAQTKRDYKDIIDSVVIAVPPQLVGRKVFEYHDFNHVKSNVNKRLYELFSQKENTDILLARYHGMKPDKLAELVWDKIRPAHESPFRKDIDS